MLAKQQQQQQWDMRASAGRAASLLGSLGGVEAMAARGLKAPNRGFRPCWRTPAAVIAEPLIQSAPVTPNIFSSRAKISDHCLPWLRNSRTRSNKEKNFDFMTLYENDYSSVQLATYRGTGEKVIIKTFRKEYLMSRPDLQQKVKLEWEIHAALDHANIIKAYLGCEDSEAVAIFMEYAGDSDAYSYMNAKQRLSLRELDARQLVHDVLSALAYLHSQGIVHRDVKSENVFRCSASGLWKLGDFGSAMRLGGERLMAKQPLKLEGTLSFAPPEYVAIWSGFNKQQLLDATSFKLDSWSVGALAYDVLCGRAPFALHENITRDAEKHAICCTDPSYPSGLSYEAVSFMKQSLEKDRQKRPSVQQLLVHPWFDGMCPRCPPLPTAATSSR